jgi:hypothetical protein
VARPATIIYKAPNVTPCGVTPIRKAIPLIIIAALMAAVGAEIACPVMSAFVQPADTPQAVTLYPATDVTQSAALLSWSASSDSNFSRYEVRMTNIPGVYHCSCTIIAKIYSANNTSCSVSGLTPNSTYYFTTWVFNNDGIYARSNEINITTDAGSTDTTPPVITIVSPRNVTYESQSVGIEWNANELVVWAGYSLDGAPQVTVTENATLEGLSLGTHTLVFFANDSSHNMGSASVTFTISSDTTPPTILHASPLTANEGSQILFFAIIMDDTNVTGAQILYRLAGEPSFTTLDMLKCPDCVDSYNATMAAPTGGDKVVEYYILASDGNNSAASPLGAPETLHSIEINSPPPPVQAITPYNVTEDSVLLDWEPSPAADFESYAVYFLQSPSQETLLATISSRGSSFYLATGLSANTTYYFFVRVYDTGLLFKDSAPVTVTTLEDGSAQPATEASSWLFQYGAYLAIVAITLAVALLLYLRLRR